MFISQLLFCILCCYFHSITVLFDILNGIIVTGWSKPPKLFRTTNNLHFCSTNFDLNKIKNCTNMLTVPKKVKNAEGAKDPSLRPLIMLPQKFK